MKQTLKSILSSVLSAAAVGVAQYHLAGGTSLKGTVVIAGVGAIVGLSNLFVQSPVVAKATALPAAEPAAAPTTTP